MSATQVPQITLQMVQDVLDSLPKPLAVTDLEGRFLIINRAVERAYGISRDKLLGMISYDMLPKDRADIFRKLDQRVAEGASIHVEIATRLSDGKERVFLCNEFPVRDAQGRPYAICGTSTEITEHRRMEKELRQATEILHGIATRTSELMKG